VVEPKPEIERGVTGFDVVLDVCSLLFDRERLIVGKWRAAGRQVERCEGRIKVTVFVGERAVGRIGNPERELLLESRGTDRATELDVVHATRHRQIRLRPHVHERSILAHRRRGVVQRIGAGHVREVIASNESVCGKQRARADHP
jgi:hypothetical protein